MTHLQLQIEFPTESATTSGSMSGAASCRRTEEEVGWRQTRPGSQAVGGPRLEDTEFGCELGQAAGLAEDHKRKVRSMVGSTAAASWRLEPEATWLLA